MIQKGFSVLEVILIVAIMGLLLLMFDQHFGVFSDGLDNEVGKLANEIRHVQRLASSRGEPCGLRLNADGYQTYCANSNNQPIIEPHVSRLPRKTQLETAHRHLLFYASGKAARPIHISLTKGSRQRHIVVKQRALNVS